MSKRYFILSAAAALLMLLLFADASADTINVSTAGSPLNLTAGQHTLYGKATDLSIQCDVGVKLTLNDVSVTSASGCALTFAGAGNELILAAGTTNSFTSGQDCPGISVATDVALTISGSGTVTATGGDGGAGIGGGSFGDGGTINISGGTVNANGGLSSSGIGGGYMGSGGNTSISGGTVTATGSAGAAGIGGNTSGGTINISGGTVTATSNSYAAGIGGGYEGDGGTIGISGGTVTATGGIYGAGIGGGYNGDGGAIGISGGKIYAARGSGNTGSQDIGHGIYATNATFTLSGSAAVFLENDSYAVPTILGTQIHYNPVPFVGNTANGITVPASWTSARGAFLPPAPDIPQTGDSSHAALWIALIAVTWAVFGVLVLALRRKRRA
jgi:hypothetical protein